MSLHRTGRALRRRSFLCAGAGLLGTAACAGASGAPPVAARPLALAPLPPGSRLEPLGGLVLDSTAIGFGGLSALHLDSALRITAVSDLARWMTARLVLRDGRPMALTELRTGVLRDGAGRPLPRGHTGDSESMARLPDGSWLVGFERWHRIRAYRNLDAPGTYVQMPPGLELAPANGGLESLAVLADGQWLAIAESSAAAQPQETRPAWLGGPDHWRPLRYQPAEGFSPADAAPLPDGGALVLERSFSLFAGFGSRLVRIPATQLRDPVQGAVLVGEELLRLGSPLPADNFEGVSAARVGDQTLVMLVSDDNQNPLQRGLLLLFVLADH
ncbi:esterase-like activity of phytase family protein [Siccirubricoccus deserti]|uniref:Esterase-like activity of phytase family protein n=1 Tax=Siccirubricoccus deserti TaxID=2013562 RepID=A0A9X0R0X9_9PROT|nr:esterase-like activity of phytase family protein [Siccirubricoccus deserti]MBC4017250.1 esterase-like activity of phytase family protein [Siccirubricoccus deserti]